MACGCASGTCNCVVQGGTGVTVAGAGTPGNPYVISAGAAGLQANDTNSVDHTLTGTGTQADPWILVSDVKRDPEAGNILTIGPNGLDVSCEAVQDCVGAGFNDGLSYDDANNQFNARPSTDPGNTTIISPNDGGIFTPSSPVTLGCGLEFGAFGEIQADVADFATLTRRNCTDSADAPGTTPLAAGCETEGMPVYCDSTDGTLRTKPEKFTETALSQMNEAHVPTITALPFTTTPIQIGATNPSDCYCMCGYVQFAEIPAVSGAPGTVVEVVKEIDLGSGVFSLLSSQTMDNRGRTALAAQNNRNVAVLQLCLDPGETAVVRFRVTYRRGPGDNGGAVSVTGTAREIRFVGSNL